MKHSLLLSLGILSFALAASAQAQGQMGNWGGGAIPSACVPLGPENRIPWPSSGYGSASAFGRAVVLELNGDYSPDAVVVAGGVAVALFDAAYYKSLQVIPGLTSVTDVATLRVGDDGVPDLLLATDSDGLVSVGWSAGAFTTPQILARGSWIGAQTLHVDDLDGDGPDDVVGISQNGLTVVTRIGGPTGFTAGLSYTPGGQVFDALSIDWECDGTRELAIATANGLYVYSGSNQIASKPSPVTSTFGCLARVHAREATAVELMAWARNATGGGSELVVVNGWTNETPLPLSFTSTGCAVGSLVPRAMLSGKYDDDNCEELLLVQNASSLVIVLQNLGYAVSGHHFDPTSEAHYDVATLSSNQNAYTGVGIPAFAQLDLYGPDDILCPVKGTNEVQAFRTLPYFRTNYNGNQPPTSDAVFPGHSEFTAGINPAYGDLRVGFKVLDDYADSNRVLVKIWEQDWVSTTPHFAGLNGTAFYASTYSLLFDTQGQLSSPYQWFHVTRGFPTGSYWNPQTNFYVELRLQKFDAATNTLVHTSPKFFGGFTLPDHDGAADLSDSCFNYLRSLGILGKDFSLQNYDGLTNPNEGPPAETLVGAYVPMNSLPSFNGTPTVNELGTGSARLFFQPPQ